MSPKNDDILVFCITLLDELVASLAEVGVTLNLEKKTKILTTQAQPPKTVTNS